MINVNSVNKNEKADLLPSFVDKPKERGSSFQDILKSFNSTYDQDNKSSVIEKRPYNKPKSYSESNNIRADKDNRDQSNSKTYSEKNKAVSKYTNNQESYSTKHSAKDNSRVTNSYANNYDQDYKAGFQSNNARVENEHKKAGKSNSALSKVEKVDKASKANQSKDNNQDNILGENITPLDVISQENFSMKDMLAFLQAVQQGNAAASNDELTASEDITFDAVIQKLGLNEEETIMLTNIVDKIEGLSQKDLKSLINSFELILESLNTTEQLSDINVLKSIGTALFQGTANIKDLEAAALLLKEKLSVEENSLRDTNLKDITIKSVNQQNIESNILDNNLEEPLLVDKTNDSALDKDVNVLENNKNISTLEVSLQDTNLDENISTTNNEVSLNTVDDVIVETAVFIEQLINTDANSANNLQDESFNFDKASSIKDVISALRELAVAEEGKKSNKYVLVEETNQQNLAEVESSLDTSPNNTSTEDIDMAINNNQDKPKDEKVSLRQESQQKLSKNETILEANNKIQTETPADKVITKEFKVLDASNGETLRAKAEEQVKVESHAKVTKVNFSDMDKSLFNNIDKAFVSQNKSGEIFSQNLRDQGNNFNYFLKSEADTIEKMENGLNEAKEAAKPYNVKDSKDITRLMKTLQSTVNKGESKLTVVLTPDNLGKLQIQLTESAGKMTAKFISDNETSHKIIMSQSDLLKNQLSEKGITIDNMEFSFSDSTSRQENFSHQSKRSKNSSGKARNGRDNGSDLEVGTQVAKNSSNGIYA